MDEIAAALIGWELYVMTGITGTCAAFLGAWVHVVDNRRRNLEKAFEAHRLCIAEHYVRREDYVQQVSLVQSKLDGMRERIHDDLSSQQAMLSRLDERTKRWEEK